MGSEGMLWDEEEGMIGTGVLCRYDGASPCWKSYLHNRGFLLMQITSATLITTN